MPEIFQTGTTPANVERPQDVPVTPKAIRRRGNGNAYTRFWKKVGDFDALTLLERKRPPPVPRTIFVDMPLPHEVWAPTSAGKKQIKQGNVPPDQVDRKVGKQAQQHWMYPSNQVTTSKYNVVTFLPKNLLEQFRRIANIFFLVVAILQFFPRFSNVSPALAALPLLAVLAITALKDAYEDLKRHQSDRFINNIGCHVLAGPGVHNPNMTTPKSRGISLRWVGNIFPALGSKRRAAKKAEKDSEKAEKEGLTSAQLAMGDDGVTPDDFDAADRQSLAGGRRNWWGSRKRAVSKSSKSGGAANGGGGGLAGLLGGKGDQKPGMPQAGAPPMQSVLFDDEDEHHQQQQTQRVSGSSVGHSATAGIETPEASAGPDRAHWRKSRWEDVRVGDFIRLRENESLPADIIICATSEEENVCYLETKNLDGETNLKVRQAVSELTHIRNARLASQAKFLVRSEAPDVNMFKYSASIEMHDGQLGKDGQPARAPVNLNTVLLRGCVLRNTEWVIGLVVFTGIDTKIVMNSGGTPSKRSRVERLMNPMVFWNLALLAAMCVMCAIGDHILEVRYFGQNAPWMYGADRSGDNPQINGLIAFANALITFQNIVPISLYISIEFVRLVQAFYIWADDEIRYEPTGRRTMARSWNLSDDLGQIEYIFSDKTGTLTQNSMQFRHCSIGGRVYKGDGQIPEGIVVPDHAGKGQAERQDDAENTQLGMTRGGASGSNTSSSGDDTQVGTSSAKVGIADKDLKPVKLAAEVQAPFHDSAIDSDLAAGGDRAERIRMFFTNLSLCHTVLASDDGEGHLEYKAQSPDEAALVQAAADAGFVFRGRDRETLNLQTPDSKILDQYELLETLEFTSARKRMSVLLRKLGPDGEPERDSPVILFAKGADNVIFERLRAGDDAYKKTTDNHLQEFASEGLRTLTLAYKTLSVEEYNDWAARYHNAIVMVEGRDEVIERVSAEIEGELTLLGATAIEDKLQDGVPEAIADLKRAGIKVWVATGDKLETAIAIGMSSNLLTRDMNLIIIKGGEYGTPKSAYNQMRTALVNFFDAQDAIDDFEYQPHDYLERQQARSRHSVDRARGQRRTSSRRSVPHIDRRASGISGLSDFLDDDNGKKPGGFGLVIDGASLQHVLSEEFSKEMLLFLATRCKAVICCRVSPLQKALVVKLVKEGLGVMCLAIGDGANDVSMIQAADVGIGVAGEEGLQAVNSSDYAIGQFRFLCRLLFIHGHWSYMRNSELIVNFFYKEIIGIGILFFFQFYCAFSTTTVYEYTLILFWNVFWTLLPVLAMGIFDRNLDQRVIMAVPEVYRYGIRNAWFGLKRFTYYMIDGIYASAICYFFLLYTYDTITARSDGYEVIMYEFSTVMAIAAVIITNLYQGFNTFAWNWWVLGSVLVGPVLILCYTAVYAAIRPGWIWTLFYGLNSFLWPAAYWWFGLLICIITSFLPKYFMRYWNENYRSSDVDILKYIHKQNPDHDFANDPAIPTGARRTPYPSKSAKAGSADPDEGLAMQTLAQQGRRMTDAEGNLVPVSSRGFAFDEDPYPRRSTGSRPASVLGSKADTRKRSRSVKLGPVAFNIPSIASPGSIGRSKSKKNRSGTVSTLGEQPEPPTPSRMRAPAYESGQPAMHVISVDPPLSQADANQRSDPFVDQQRPQ